MLTSQNKICDSGGELSAKAPPTKKRGVAVETGQFTLVFIVMKTNNMW